MPKMWILLDSLYEQIYFNMRKFWSIYRKVEKFQRSAAHPLCHITKFLYSLTDNSLVLKT